MTLLPPVDAWSELTGQPLAPLRGGLINDSFVVGAPPRAVLQRLHTVFAPEVNLDIEAITGHIAAGGMPTPHLLRTTNNRAWTEDAEGRCWRAIASIVVFVCLLLSGFAVIFWR